jgi:hypothetical protein
VYLESRAREIPPLKEASVSFFKMQDFSRRYNRKMEKHSVSALHPSQVNTQHPWSKVFPK